ncbi:MAG: TRAP transporter small permease subunit [Thermotaleaceae bacterium]
MKKVDIIEKILEIGTFLAFTGLLIVVLLQVVTRFFMPALSFVWTEEASRFLFVYSVAFGAPLAMKRKEFVNVDILTSILPKGVRKFLEILSYLITVILFTVVFLKGIDFAELGVVQKSITMRIPMSIAFSTISITSFFILLYTVLHLFYYLRDIGKTGDNT